MPRILEREFQFQKRTNIPYKQLIDENLSEDNLYTRNLMLVVDDVESILTIVEEKLNMLEKKKEIFIGSDFPGDNNQDTLYRLVTDIVLCVEGGITCVIINLDNIY